MGELAFDEADGLGNRLIDVEFAGIEEVGVVRLAQGRNLSFRVPLVAGTNIEEHVVIVTRHAALEKLAHSALRPDFRARGNEQLGIGVRSDDCPDIAPVQDRSALPRL